MNTAALKTFAPAMRRQLLEAVGRKLDLLLNSQTPDTLSTYSKQIGELHGQEAENREQLLERVAYTWFNRLCALRYLDARGWHPFGGKVLMPAAEGETQPELLKLMRAGNLPSALQSHTDEDRLHGLLDGQIQTAIAGADPQGEVYRQLVLAVCRCYYELLPNLFEGLDDASELLLPDDLLSDGSIVGAFRKEITDDDCQDVESLGWLYQFYIAEKKDEVMARKKAVPTEDIPAVTQLFTPHWIVRYLVENSLGRLWLLNRPGSKLRDQMPYYIEGDAETDFLVINKPEEIKLLDPACGSGHMLTYAFDLLVLIYEEEGYSPNEIPGLILKNNLHGLEICPRAAQLAELALVFKAREQSRRFFQPEQLVKPQIIELQDVQFADGELNDYIEALDLGELFDPSLFKLLHQFEEAKNFGSLIQPCLEEQAITDVRRAIEAKELGGQLFLRETHLKVLRVLEQAEALTQRYQLVVANPPYMGGKQMNASLKEYLGENLNEGKADLYSAFLQRNASIALAGGLVAMITIPNWMFIEAFEELRSLLIENVSIQSLVHNGRGVWGADFGSCAFVLITSSTNVLGKYFKLFNKPSEVNTNEALSIAFLGMKDQPIHLVGIREFGKLPGSSFLYWFNRTFRDLFLLKGKVLDHGGFKRGLATGDNDKFLRFWHEVSVGSSTCIEQPENARWHCYNKGGDFRKWYGNKEYFINWENNGFSVRNFKDEKGKVRSRPQNIEHAYKPAVSYSSLTIGVPSFRFFQDCLSDQAGNFLPTEDKPKAIQLLALLNSRPGLRIAEWLSPTVNILTEDLNNIPMPVLSCDCTAAEACVDLARADWDNFENSWDFAGLPVLQPGLKKLELEASWKNWEVKCGNAIRRMQDLETENNRLFISAYGLDGELQPEVPEDQITLARADQRKDIAAFLSYATGCMMGRYSLDQPGLILANAGDTLENYYAKVGKSSDDLSFEPDPDGIIPVLDGEWFEDDIVARTRELLTVTFPESSVAENLRFIEESIGKDIRKYFCSEFYKDHLQTYKKRPIYWLVQSPKKGFSCLIYLHRYTKDTLNQVLNNYFRPYLQKLEAHLAQLGLDQLNDDLPTRERTAARKEAEKIAKVLKECQAWEQDALLPLAQQRIELDLDDGVKVNYLKLQDVLAPIPGLAAKED